MSTYLTPSNQGSMRNNRRTSPHAEKGEVIGTLKLNAISSTKRRTRNIESAKEVQTSIMSHVIDTS